MPNEEQQSPLTFEQRMEVLTRRDETLRMKMELAQRKREAGRAGREEVDQRLQALLRVAEARTQRLKDLNDPP